MAVISGLLWKKDTIGRIVILPQEYGIGHMRHIFTKQLVSEPNMSGDRDCLGGCSVA